ncbi:MAG: ABC transporter ATP-binding protein [Planctomycetota bacterium]
MMNDTSDSKRRPLLEIDGLSVSFGNSGSGDGGRLIASDRVSMSVYAGQTLAVVGESGSGKSVSAMSVLGLIPTPPGRYDGGRILWRGGEVEQDLLTLSEKKMRKVRGREIAMIFQEPMTSLNPVYTIGEQITEAVLLHQDVSGAEAVGIAERALRDVGIAEPAGRLKEYPHQLSGGMRQRVMIAMALACEPELLLADEPTTALDVTIQAQILELLRKLQVSRGMAMMLITHDLGVVAENADTVAVMFAGRVVEFTDVHTLFERPLHPYTRGLLGSMPVLGQTVDRLGTVDQNATIPVDFPSGYKVAEHDASAAGTGAYGGEGSLLHEVEPGHWVLCTAEGAGKPTAARLSGVRNAATAAV